MWKRISIVAVLALAMASTAGAALNVWYDVPDYASADADAKMTYFKRTNSAGGYISIRNYGSSCVYVQRAPVARLALDGDWKRSTGDKCGAGSALYSWSDSFWLDYDGFKFRVCKDVFGPDPCGSSVTIYP